jgi:hypothetical protein
MATGLQQSVLVLYGAMYVELLLYISRTDRRFVFITSEACYLPCVTKCVYLLTPNGCTNTYIHTSTFLLQWGLIFCSLNPSRKILRYYFKKFYVNTAELFLIHFSGSIHHWTLQNHRTWKSSLNKLKNRIVTYNFWFSLVVDMRSGLSTIVTEKNKFLQKNSVHTSTFRKSFPTLSSGFSK